ncbi:S1C family serine protease, partial [Streptomyces sp. NPDC059374]|uniref:S1C family serine protease n=1 Tax=Streptomyces sp. NPDC059374 TaxID=3346814 RepID=UPI0036828234
MDVRRPPAPRPSVAAAVLLMAALLLAGCSGPSSPRDPRDATSQAAAPRARTAADDLQDAYLRVIQDVLPSVVQIQAKRDLGSGVVYDDKGHIVTNAHVVGNEKTFRVTTAGSERELTARLVASYPPQDLAVVRLDDPPDGLRPATFGDSPKVRVGQIVLAMGSPLGLSSSVTQGIVSATGRNVTEGGDDGGTGATIANMVQTSAAINPGNSGGALVDRDSQVGGTPPRAARAPGAGG